MKLVVLDAYTVFPATDIHWNAFAALHGVEGLEVYDRTSAGELMQRIADADAVLTNKVKLDAVTISRCPSLKYIGVLATGYNVVDVESARRRGITVTNIPSYSTMSVAQQVFALLLEATNRVGHYSSVIRDGKWTACPDFSFRDFDMPELAGKIFGIVGLGNIGSAVASIAAAFGMKIAVTTSKDVSRLPAGYDKVELDDLFRMADVISLHCPLTPSTYHLVDARRLSLMKRSAILINTSRGPVIDEDALAVCLLNGGIAAAGVDVLCDEPPRVDNPLLKAPNCVITPHIAWASTEARRRLFEIACSNFSSFLDGKPINTI